MKKKLLVLTVGVGLSFALLTGCGTPSTKDLVDKMYDSKVQSADMNVVFDIDISANLDGNKSSVTASGDFNIAAANMDKIEDMVASVDGTVKYDLIGMLSDKQEVSAYVEYGKDEMTAYVEQDGEWYKSVQETPEAAEVDEEMVKKMQAASKEIWYKANLEKATEKVEDQECYVLTLQTSLNDYMPMLQSVMNEDEDLKEQWDDMISSMEEQLDCSASEIFECVVVDTKAYVSKKDKYMVACDMDFAGIDVNKIMELTGFSWDSLTAITGMEISDFAINDLFFGVTLKDINKTNVEIPAEAKDAEELPAMGSFGGDDYNWDEDDDDYSWDEDEDFEWDDEDEDFEWDDEDEESDEEESEEE